MSTEKEHRRAHLPYPTRVFPRETVGEAFPEQEDSWDTVEEIMLHGVPTVEPGFDAGTIADLLLASDAGGLPVVRGDRLVGFVTLAGAAREALESADTTPQARLRLTGRRGVTYPTGAGFHAVSAPARAVDFMLPAGLAVTVGTPIRVVAAKLAHHGLASLPVVEEDGSLAGVVSALDILRWLARPTGVPVRRHGAVPLKEV